MDTKLNFTKEAISSIPLPSPRSRQVYHDKKTQGLQLRVTHTGAKTFSVFRRVKGGQPERMTLGKFPAMSVEQARKLAARINSEIEEGSNPAQVKRAHKGEPSLTEFFKEYGERHGKKKKSWGDDQQRYRDYLGTPLGSKKLTAITMEMIGRVLSDMDRDGRAGATVNNVRALASGIFGKAIEWGYVKDNPVKGTKTRKSNKRDRFIQGHELPRFFTALAQEDNETLRDFFIVSLLTGARRANVLSMSWANVSLDDRIWRIPETKNGEPQNVTLSPEAVTLLTTRKEVAKKDATYVFPGTGKKGHLVEPKRGWARIFDRDELNQLIERIQTAGGSFTPQADKDGNVTESLDHQLERAKEEAQRLKVYSDSLRLTDLRIHDLRRTLGSWQAKSGASLAIIGKSLNHKSHQSTQIYARLDLDPVRESVNTATTAILKAAGVEIKAKAKKN